MERVYTQSATNAFPVHVLPERLQRIIRELHDSNGFPVDYTAASMMAALSVAVGNSHRVEVKRNWHESAILYIAIVGRPGACKSHPLAFAMRPLVNADWKNNLDYQKKYAEYQQAIAMSRKERVHAGFEQFPKEPKRLRYLVSDVTQEGLSAIHSHNPRGLCLWVDELSAWFKNFTRYNNGSEEQFWLSAFNGSTTMSDRKNSQNSIFIKRPFIYDGQSKPQNILQSTVGYEALLLLMVEIIYRERLSSFNSETFIGYVSSLKNIQFGDTNMYPMSTKGKRILYLSMSLAVYPATDNTDERISKLEQEKAKI